VGQIWVIGTVALITQFGMAVWFCAGIAVAFATPIGTAKIEDGPDEEMLDNRDTQSALLARPERTRLNPRTKAAKGVLN